KAKRCRRWQRDLLADWRSARNRRVCHRIVQTKKFHRSRHVVALRTEDDTRGDLHVCGVGRRRRRSKTRGQCNTANCVRSAVGIGQDNLRKKGTGHRQRRSSFVTLTPLLWPLVVTDWTASVANSAKPSALAITSMRSCRLIKQSAASSK